VSMTFEPPFHSEADLQSAVEKFFREHDVPHVAKYKLPDGGECDMVLLNEPGGSPMCILEFKNGLDLGHTSVKDLASHFEQCLKYHLKTGWPVFLGPYFSWGGSNSSYFSGGAKASATAAFSAYGGRMNVGLFFVHSRQPATMKSWTGFSAVLRQRRVVFYEKPGYLRQAYASDAWPVDGKITMVDFMGAASKKVRAAK
jgi:hypothetical protein